MSRSLGVRRRLALLTAVVLMWPAALAGAAPAAEVFSPKVHPDADDPAAVHGGAYVTGVISDPKTFNLQAAQETSSTEAVGLLFDGLVEMNFRTGEIEPALAESWTLADDRGTWTFRLRRGVKWHDGRPFTAADVDFTLRAAFAPGGVSSERDVLTFDGKPVRWRVVDPLTIQIVMPKPIGFFLRLAGIAILPKHKLEAALAQGGAAFIRAWGVNTPPRELVGTGPYRMMQYVPGQRLSYARWTEYWKTDKQGRKLPYFDRVVTVIVPNLEALRLRFMARETDIYAARPREYADLKAKEREGAFTVIDGREGYGSELLVFNQNPAGVTDPKLTWFRDTRFRRALQHAIDRDGIVAQVYGGRATPAYGPISRGNTVYYNQSLPAFPYDLARAERQLAEAGYVKSGDRLRDGAGNAVAFTLTTNSENNDRVAIGNIVRQDLVKLGIRVTFAPEAFNSLVARLDGSRKWETMIMGLTGSIEPGTGRNVWVSSGSINMWHPGQKKPSAAWEAEIDQLFEQVATEFDQNKRKAAYHRWQQIMSEQSPMLFFTNPKSQVAVRNTIGSVKTGLGGAISPTEILYRRGGGR